MSYKFVINSIKTGILEDRSKHLIDATTRPRHGVTPIVNTPRSPLSSSLPTAPRPARKKTRTPFTRKDDDIIFLWTQRAIELEMAIQGKNLYIQMERAVGFSAPIPYNLLTTHSSIRIIHGSRGWTVGTSISQRYAEEQWKRMELLGQSWSGTKDNPPSREDIRSPVSVRTCLIMSDTQARPTVQAIRVTTSIGRKTRLRKAHKRRPNAQQPITTFLHTTATTTPQSQLAICVPDVTR